MSMFMYTYTPKGIGVDPVYAHTFASLVYNIHTFICTIRYRCCSGRSRDRHPPFSTSDRTAVERDGIRRVQVAH